MKKLILVFFSIVVFLAAAVGCKSAPPVETVEEEDLSIAIDDDTKTSWVEIGESDFHFIEIEPGQPVFDEAETPVLLSGEDESETPPLLSFEGGDDTVDNSIMTGDGFEILTQETNGEIRHPDIMASEPDINPIEFQVTHFSVPLISRFETGKYYVQLASFQNAELAQSELARIGNGLPVVIMKTNVIIRGEDTLVHRILIGPVSYGESRIILQRFKAAYGDAFVWLGR